MCYNGLLLWARISSRPALFMSRRPAVLLTSPRSIPDSSLFCFFCTLVQKSEAHPLPFQPLPASLQKRRECLPSSFLEERQQRFPLSPASPAFSVPSVPSVLGLRSCFTLTSLFVVVLHHEIEAHLFYFQSLPHSFAKTPGCHPARFPFSSILVVSLSTLQLSTLNSHLTPFRINTYAKARGGLLRLYIIASLLPYFAPPCTSGQGNPPDYRVE